MSFYDLFSDVWFYYTEINIIQTEWKWAKMYTQKL